MTWRGTTPAVIVVRFMTIAFSIAAGIGLVVCADAVGVIPAAPACGMAFA